MHRDADDVGVVVVAAAVVVVVKDDTVVVDAVVVVGCGDVVDAAADAPDCEGDVHTNLWLMALLPSDRASDCCCWREELWSLLLTPMTG